MLIYCSFDVDASKQLVFFSSEKQWK